MFQKFFRNLFHRFDKPKDVADFLFHVIIDRQIKLLKIMPVKYDLPLFFHKLKDNLKVISTQVILKWIKKDEAEISSLNFSAINNQSIAITRVARFDDGVNFFSFR